MGVMDLMKAIAKRVTALIPEKKLVHRNGKTFAETFHVKPVAEPGTRRETKTKEVPKQVKRRAMELDKGHPVKFKTDDATYHRTGVITRVNPLTYTIEGKRNSEGKKPTYKVPKESVIPIKDYRKYLQVEPRKTSASKITTEGDKANAHYNLAAEELKRRKHVIEKRLGFKEDDIIKHPSFVGPAIKITSELAKENGITPTVRESNLSLWHRATNADHQEMLFAYTLGALKAWRRVLSEEDPKKAADTKMNVQQFKEVIKGKRKSSYAHMVMEKEGKAAAIRYLQEMRERRDLHEDTDISDMENDPAGRRVLDRNSTQPQQLNYALATNHESFGDDLQKVVSALAPHEREVIRAKYGFHPYKMTPEETRDGPNKAQRSNDEVADLLNSKDIDHPTASAWNRNHVGTVHAKVMESIRNSPAKDDLSFHYDQKLGRQVWKSQEEELGGLQKSYPEAEVNVTSRGICLVMTEELRKSYSSDLAQNNPGGRWMKIDDENSLLHGQHIYLIGQHIWKSQIEDSEGLTKSMRDDLLIQQVEREYK